MKNVQFEKPNASENEILIWKISFGAEMYIRMYH